MTRDYMSQREAVKNAMGNLGESATLPQLKSFISVNYGMRLSKDQIGKAKYSVMKKEKEKSVSDVSETTSLPIISNTPPIPLSIGVMMDDISTLKELVNKLGGPEVVKKLITLVAS